MFVTIADTSHLGLHEETNILLEERCCHDYISRYILKAVAHMLHDTMLTII